MQQPSREDLKRSVDYVIRCRETRKILGDTESEWDHPIDCSASLRSEFDLEVKGAIATAGWAPFHHSRKALDVMGRDRIHEPWRFYHLDRSNCVKLLGKIDDILDSDVRRGKIPGLLAGAGAAVLVTWLPESTPGESTPGESTPGESTPGAGGPDPDKLRLRNEEHLAAAAAAVQNLLLACEARSMATYWSSGGLLRDSRMFRCLEIPPDQRLLAAVFLAPPLDEFRDRVDCKSGSLRDVRADWSKWCRSVVLGD